MLLQGEPSKRLLSPLSLHPHLCTSRGCHRPRPTLGSFSLCDSAAAASPDGVPLRG